MSETSVFGVFVGVLAAFVVGLVVGSLVNGHNWKQMEDETQSLQRRLDICHEQCPH